MNEAIQILNARIESLKAENEALKQEVVNCQTAYDDCSDREESLIAEIKAKDKRIKELEEALRWTLEDAPNIQVIDHRFNNQENVKVIADKLKKALKGKKP